MGRKPGEKLGKYDIPYHFTTAIPRDVEIEAQPAQPQPSEPSSSPAGTKATATTAASGSGSGSGGSKSPKKLRKKVNRHFVGPTFFI